MSLTPIPSLDRTASTFKSDVDTFFGSRIPTLVTELNTLQSDVTIKQSDAASSAAAAAGSASSANASRIDAQAAQSAAAASAATAVSAPGTSATSTNSLTIETGSVSLTIQVGKSIVPGMSLKIASTASPSNWMHGDCQSYNSSTGALVVQASSVSGSGTFSAWTVSLSAPGGSTTDFLSLSNRPTTLSGYGITDATPKNATLVDKGTIGAGATVTFSVADEYNRAQASGNTTIALNGFATAGKLSQSLIKLVNFGGKTITFPTINWIKPDGSVTTTFSSLGVTLQTTGVDNLIVWSDDAGSTVYGKFLR